MADRQPINPYAPTIETNFPLKPNLSAAESTEEIRFAGTLDVNSVRNTDYIALGIGLFLGIGFGGLLLVSGLSAIIVEPPAIKFAGFVLILPGVSILLAVWLFVHSQRKRPLRRFPWMAGMVRGILYSHRIDIQWEVGEASLSLPKLTPTTDFVNRYGRLFVCRGIHCFIPSGAVDPGGWLRLRSFRPRQTRAQGPAPAPDSPTGAMVWQCGRDEFVRDRERHRFSCEPAAYSRVVFWVCGVLCLASVMASSRPPIMAVASFASGMFISGLLWSLREGVRRNWRFRYRDRMPLSRYTDATNVPAYPRWITDDEIMIGLDDGWFRLPCNAIKRAVVSQHGVEFLVGTEKVDTWFLERGGRSDEQWRDVIVHLSNRIADTQLFGTAMQAKDA